MATQKGEILEELVCIKTVITKQKEEIVSEINVKVDTNGKNIITVLEENRELKRENNKLKDKVSNDKVCSMKMMMNTDNVESSLLTSIY